MQAARIQRRRCNTSNAMHSGRNVWSRHSLCSKYAPRNTSFSFFVYLSFTCAPTHMPTCLFSSASYSHSLFLSLFLYLFHSVSISYLIQKSPMRDLSKYNHFSRILLESSRLVYRVSYVSAFVYSVRKMHINTEVHFDASSATPGSLSHCSFDGDRYL